MSDERNALVFTVKQAAFRLKIGRDLLYRAIREGRLVAKKDGRRTLITARSIDAYLDALPNLSADDLMTRRPAAKRKGATPNADAST